MLRGGGGGDCVADDSRVAAAADVGETNRLGVMSSGSCCGSSNLSK